MRAVFRIIAGALLLQVAGCGDATKPLPRGVLLADDFSLFLADNWESFGDGGKDGLAGNPAPSLDPNGFNNTIWTKDDFDVSEGIELRFDMGVLAAAGGVRAFGLYEFLTDNETGTTNTIGAMSWTATNGTGGELTASLSVGTEPGVSLSLGTAGSGFHSFRFELEGSGDARWSVDDVLIAEGSASGNDSKIIALSGFDAAEWRIDNVVLERP